MRRLRKKGQLCIRFSEEQLVKLRKAARQETERRLETIEPGTLGRELIMAGVDRILAHAREPEPAAA